MTCSSEPYLGILRYLPKRAFQPDLREASCPWTAQFGERSACTYLPCSNDIDDVSFYVARKAFVSSEATSSRELYVYGDRVHACDDDPVIHRRRPLRITAPSLGTRRCKQKRLPPPY